MGTLVIPLGDFKVMVMFIVNTLGVLRPIPFGVWLKYPWGISSSTVEYYSKYSRGTVTDMYVPWWYYSRYHS